MTIKVHYGHTVNSEVPVTGVIANNAISQFIGDEFSSSINLDWERAIQDHKLECTNQDCIESDHQDFSDSWDSQPNDTLLIGDWIHTDHAESQVIDEYAIDYNGSNGFAMIVRESESQIVWSKTVKRVSRLCSPCFPGQADLDSGDASPESESGFMAYTLPKECFYS